MYPRRDLELGRAFDLEIRRFSGKRIAHYFPGIAGHVSLVNQDDASRALARGFFILISPTSVVSERRSLEELHIVGRRLVYQHEQHFPPYVSAFVVIPLVFGRLDAIAD